MAVTRSLLLLGLALALVPAAVSAATYTYTYDFTRLRVGGQWRGDRYEEPGMPVVPTVTARVLVPHGERVRTVRVVPENVVERRGVAAPAAPSYVAACRVKHVAPPPAVFVAGQSFPATHSGEWTVQQLLGAPIAVVPLFPTRFFPAERRISIAGAATVILETEPGQEKLAASYRGIETDRRDIAESVDNPSLLSTYPKRAGRATGEYLVIGPRALVLPPTGANPLETLVAEKRARQISTMIVALEDVVAGFPGRDVPEKIRNAVRKHYTESGTRYLLLVGDGYTQTPARVFHMYEHNGIEELDISADMYFGCLDGDFDANANNVFGEPSDGADFQCEVAVGRAPAVTPEQLRVFVDKTLALQKVAYADPRVWRGLAIADAFDEETPGAPAMERLIHGSSNMVRTQGFPQEAVFQKLYEKVDEEFAPEVVINAINAGDFYTVNQAGHGNFLYAMKFNAKDIPKLTNPSPFLGYTSACHDGDLTQPNWASQMVLHPAGGAGVMVANAHYGWYSKRQPEGLSNVFHRAYFEMRFSRGVKEVGRMNAKAKELFLGMVKKNLFVRHVIYELNVLGDPELQMKF